MLVEFRHGALQAHATAHPNNVIACCQTLPMSSTPVLPAAFFCSSDTQCLAFLKESSSVMSYTIAAAAAPR